MRINSIILLGNGNGAFANPITFSSSIGSHPYSVAVGDFNDDTLLDIAVANYGTSKIDVLTNNGNETLENQTIYSIDNAALYSIAAVDFNRDNKMDLVVTNNGINNIALLLGYGNGTFDNPATYSTGASSSVSFATGDFNKDTWLDIVVVNNDTGSIHIHFGYYGRFKNQMTYSTGFGPWCVAVSDFNNDTRLDIVAANWGSNDVSVLPGYSNIVFVNQMTLSAGNNSRPRSFAIGDFNNDAQMDIAIANSGIHTIGIFFGYGNISFVNQAICSTGPCSSPYSIAVGHFNNDTRLAIVVTNHGSDNVGIFSRI